MFPRILKKFRTCVREGKIVVTQHAFEEMNDDDLLQADLEHCILVGDIIERQWDAEFHEWKYVVAGKSTAGDSVRVVLKPGRNDCAVVITTYLI